MPRKKKPTHGGKRPGSGRPAVGGKARTARVEIRTTPETAQWFHDLAQDHGSKGAALEHLHQTDVMNTDSTGRSSEGTPS